MSGRQLNQAELQIDGYLKGYKMITEHRTICSHCFA